jgi:four helix bundle protein
MAFHATELAFQAVRALPAVFDRLKGKDAELSSQLRTAAWSMVLNLEEGTWKAGKDRLNRYRIAAGSASEVRAGLRLAVEWGYVDQEMVREAMNCLEQMLAILWTIVGKREEQLGKEEE